MDNDSIKTTERLELEDRLAAARERAASARNHREALEDKGAFERKVVKAELEASDQEALARLEEEHGANKIATVDTELGLIVLRRAGTLRYKRFQDKESMKTADIEQLVRPCVIHPSKDRFDTILDEMPATLVRCADRVAVLAGVRSSENRGKS